MPEKEMQNLKVYVSERGFICLAQANGIDDDSIVDFHPDQAELVIRWIQEAVEESKNVQ